MKIYNITEVLPLIKSYEGIIIQPTGITEDFTIETSKKSNDKTDTHYPEVNIVDYHLPIDEYRPYFDNGDEDFVKRNIEQGQFAENYVNNLMIKWYENCEKVKACEGYDFKVHIEGREIKIEVKSIQSYNAPFHMTINEIDHATRYFEDYYICFIVVPSLEKGVKDIRFLCNPIRNLGIAIPLREFEGQDEKCTIVSEKFLIKPKTGFVFTLPNELTNMNL